MKRKILIISVLAYSVAGYCDQASDAKLMAQAGISLPAYNEIKIIPSAIYTETKNIKNKNDAHIEERIKEDLAMHNEQSQKGYVESYQQRVSELLNMKNVATYQMKTNLSPDNTELRTNVSDLKLAYSFVGVPPSSITTNIGFVPYGAYKSTKNGDEGDGWDGAVQFFEKSDIGTCAFTEHNRKLAGVGIELVKELITYDIANKPSLVLIMGNKESGFVYKVEWYDATFTRELECANPEFSTKLRKDFIDLANIIEAAQ